jgi:hypothetical protein
VCGVYRLHRLEHYTFHQGHFTPSIATVNIPHYPRDREREREMTECGFFVSQCRRKKNESKRDVSRPFVLHVPFLDAIVTIFKNVLDGIQKLILRQIQTLKIMLGFGPKKHMTIGVVNDALQTIDKGA